MMKTLRNLGLAAVLALSTASVSADTLAGAYLAGRQADAAKDFSSAANYYTRALVLQPGNPELMESTALALLQKGDFDRALPVAQTMESEGHRSQVAQLIVMTDLARSDSFAELIDRSNNEELGVGPLIDGLVKAWSEMGSGQVTEALTSFDALSAQQGLRGFALYHKALALGLVGDFESAEAIFANESEAALQLTRRGAMARAEILSQLERNEDALRGLTNAFGTSSDPGIAALRQAIEAGEPVPFSHVTSAKDGIAEVFYSIAAALTSESQPDYALIYTRTALALRADHSDARLLAAELLTDLKQHELAIAAFATVPNDHVDFHAAELGRAGALRALDKPDAALEVLNQLAKTHGKLPIVHSTRGDILRQQDRFSEAVTAYDAALERTPDGARSQWFLHYARAIAYERLDDWTMAEADFRRALELSPDQPQVLNYLGYSMVEKKINLDEALEMIERAVAARPDSGYIVDSLGWVLFRLGRYDEAVEHMEKAVELMPVDPVVNDHLGDVYWAVGRYREADFQWSRALSFIDEDNNDSEADPVRLRRKMAVGLDKVLAEEGAEPLKVADDN